MTGTVETNAKRAMDILGKNIVDDMKNNQKTFETVPISMRMNDVTLSKLKEKARKLSFERNDDISYVDLIREAVEKAYEIEIPAVGLFGDTTFETGRFDYAFGGFWTDEMKDRFLGSPTGKMFQTCIDTGDFKEYVDFAKEQINAFILSHSLGCKLLSKTSGIGGVSGSCSIVRDVGSVANVISRRGAVPDHISEGEMVYVPGFDIACHPCLKNSDTTPMSLFNCMITISWAIVKEIDTNIINCLNAAIDSRAKYGCSQISNYPLAEYTGRDSVLSTCSSVAQHGITPSAILVNTTSYIDMVKGKLVDGPDLKTALDTGNYGTFEGIPIHVSVRAKNNDIIICGPSGMVGVFYIPGKVGMTYINKSEKLSHSFVCSIRLGVCVANDWAVALLRIGNNDDEKPSSAEEKMGNIENIFNVQINGENKGYVSLPNDDLNCAKGKDRLIKLAQSKISLLLAGKRIKKKLVVFEDKTINFVV